MQMLPIVFLPQILFSGVVIDVNLVPPGIRWLQYFCYLKYTLDLIFINEFEDKMDQHSVVKDYLNRNYINKSEISFNRLIVAALIIGLRLVGEHPHRYRRVVVSNTGLNTGDRAPSEAFMQWQQFSQTTPNFPIGRIVDGGCVRDLSAAEIAAYEAPFPDDSHTAGPRTMPSLVPTSPDDPASAANRAAWTTLESFDRPLLTAFSDRDPVTAGGERAFQYKVPGAAGQAHITVENAGHFVQEDAPARLASIIIEFIAATPD